MTTEIKVNDDIRLVETSVDEAGKKLYALFEKTENCSTNMFSLEECNDLINKKTAELNKLQEIKTALEKQ